MDKTSNNRSLIIFFLVTCFIFVSTYLISIFARGYRFSLKNGFTLSSTGIISAVSRPKGASVYIDDQLVTATDDTINLSPGIYNLKINKDGFVPWQKTVTVKPETVYQADIQLFSAVPDLKPITLTGAINPSANVDNTKIAYSIASASATKDNGLYIIETNGLPISLIRGISHQISSNSTTINWSKFTFTFSPNSRQILATNKDKHLNYLLSLDTPINSQKLVDITNDMEKIEKDWQTQTSLIINAKLERLPKEIRPLVSTSSAKDIQPSTNEDKILYLAQIDGDIKKDIITPPPAQSTQIQSRQVKKGNYYVYDTKDDTNFLIGNSSNLQNPSWIPNSNNIIFVENNNLKVVDYDGTNQQTLFASNFDINCVYPWNDGSKIVILTAPYPTAPQNLYAISIK
ncbi:MAG: PEGA domain-containing protein [Candidatus Shapirobacteria bacterium]|jgi:hypothetical protein